MAAPIQVGITIHANGGAQVTSQINQVTGAVNHAGTAAQNTTRNFATMAREALSLNNVLGALGVTIGLAGLVGFSRSMVQTIQEIQNMSTRLKGLTKDTQDYANVQAYLSDVSARHHKSNLAMADSFSQLLILEKAGLITRKMSVSLLEGMSNASSKTGASIDQLKTSMYGFSQAMGQGTIQLTELGQVTEPIPGLINEVAKAAGYTVGEFRKLVGESRITSEMFGRIMVAAFESYQGAAEKAGDGLTAKYADISNAYQDLARLLEAPVSSALTPILEGIASLIKNMIADTKELGIALNFIFTQEWNSKNLADADAKMNEIAKKFRKNANTGGASGSWDDGKTGSWDTSTGPEAIRKEIEATKAATTAKKEHEKATKESAKTSTDSLKQYNDQIALQVLKENGLFDVKMANLGIEKDKLKASYQAKQIDALTYRDEQYKLIDQEKAYKLKWIAEEAALNKQKLTDKLSETERYYQAIMQWENRGAPRTGQVNKDTRAVGMGQAKPSTLIDPGFGVEPFKPAVEKGIAFFKGKIEDVIKWVKENELGLKDFGLSYFKGLVKSLGSYEKAIQFYGDRSKGYLPAVLAAYEKLPAYADRQINLDKQVAESASQTALAKIEAKKSTMAVDAEYEATLKAQADKEKQILTDLQDKYNKLTMSARDYFQSTLTNNNISPAGQAPIMAQFDKNAGVENKKASIDAANSALTAYNTSIDTAKLKTSELGAITTAVFDGALGGVNILAGAFDTMTNKITSATEALDENSRMKALNDAQPDSKAKLANAAAFAKKEQALEKEIFSAKVTMSRQLAGVLSDNLKKGTTEQKVAHSIEMGLVGVELAQNILKITGIGMVTAAKVAAVGPSVAASAATGTAAAAAGIAEQAKAGPYIGFALMAVMAGLMAALGFATGGGGGSYTAPEPPDSPTTGGVLGDRTASSQSVQNTYDLLKEIHAKEYIELRGINEGVAALSGGILNTITRAFQSGNTAGTNVPYLGVSKHKIVSGGIATQNILIGELLDQVEIVAAMYNTDAKVKKTKKKTTYTYKDYYSEINPAVKESMQDVLESVANTMQEVGKSFGDAIGKDFFMAVRSYIVPALKIDLLLLDGEAAAKKMNAAISTMVDTMATELFGTIVEDYQQLGEGMLETTIRLVAEMAVVKDSLGEINLSLTQNVLSASNALVKVAGGVAQFKQQFEDFYDLFFTDAEKQKRQGEKLYVQLADVFSDEMISVMAASRAGYRTVMESININTMAGQKQLSTLLELSSAADDWYSSVEDATSARDDAIQTYIDALNAEKTALESLALEKAREKVSAYDKERDKLQKAYTSEANALKAVITEMDGFGKTIRATIATIKAGALGPTTDKYANAKALFNENAGTLKAGRGSTDESKKLYAEAVSGLSGKAGNYLETALNNSKTAVDYAREYNTVMGVMSETLASVETQKTDAEKQLEALDLSVGTLLTINDSVLSVREAIEKLNLLQADRDTAALVIAEYDANNTAVKLAEIAAKDATNEAKNARADTNRTHYSLSEIIEYGKNNNLSTVEDWYSAAVKYNADVYAVGAALGLSKTGTDDALKNIKRVPGFKKGGSHSGGWRIVGENGPEIENTGPSRIFSHSQTKSIMSFDELIKEIKELKETTKEMQQEIKIGQATIASNTKDTSKVLRLWDGDGMPAVRA